MLEAHKGGIWFHPGVTKEEVMALSTWMTWKVLLRVFPMVAASGIVVDPKSLSSNELQRLSKAYAQWLVDAIGPWIDIPAPDVNTNGQIMTWMVDAWATEFSKKHPLTQNPQATFTGNRSNMADPKVGEATGLGGVCAGCWRRQLLEENKTSLSPFKALAMLVTGLPTMPTNLDIVGGNFRLKGGVYVESGLNPRKPSLAKQNGSLAECFAPMRAATSSMGK